MDQLPKAVGFGSLQIIRNAGSYPGTHNIIWWYGKFPEQWVNLCCITKELWDGILKDPNHYLPFIKEMFVDYKKNNPILIKLIQNAKGNSTKDNSPGSTRG